MALYCSVPNCKNGPGNVTEGIGFYKFPLTDRVREQQWLKNMDCEKWAPSHPYYVCEEHFPPSSFVVQWCVRHISNEAAPTVVHKGQKRKATAFIEERAKQPRVHVTEVDKMSDDGSLEHSVEDFLKQVKDRLTGASSFLVDSDEGVGDNADVGEEDDTEGERDETEGEGDETDEGERDDTDEGEGDDTDEGEGDESDEGDDTVSDEDSIEYQDQQPEEHCTDQLQAIIADLQKNVKVLQQREHQQLHKLAVLEKQVICLRQTEALTEERLQMLERKQKQKALYGQHPNSASEQFSSVLGAQDIQLTAQFPFTFPSNSAQRNSTADTVLTSALGSTSTLPIQSNHVPPMPEIVVIRDYGLDSDSDEGEGDYRRSEEVIMECNSQLEVIIADLQKMVKVLQQQDRQRLERCMGLENAVSQLEQNHKMKDMQLRLLERKRKATDEIGNPPKRRRLDNN